MTTRVKAGKDFTGYMIGKHSDCNGSSVTTRWHVGSYYFKGWAADGRTPLDLTTRIPCSGSCGKSFQIDGGRPVYGRYVEEVICNDKCMGASGPSCDCSCGGMNHGGGH
jgi:hypothetical protein